MTCKRINQTISKPHYYSSNRRRNLRRNPDATKMARSQVLNTHLWFISSSFSVHNSAFTPVGPVYIIQNLVSRVIRSLDNLSAIPTVHHAKLKSDQTYAGTVNWSQGLVRGLQLDTLGPRVAGVPRNEDAAVAATKATG